MSGPTSRAAAAGYASVTLAVMTAPTVLLTQVAHRGSTASPWQRPDLLAAAGAVAACYALVVYRRIVRPPRRRTDQWIAALHALVVLAVLTPVLLAAVLYALGPLQRWLGAQPIVLFLLWAGIHLLPVTAAEATRRAVIRWLGGDH